MDPEFVKYLASLGVGGTLAGVMFFVYRKDVAGFMAEIKVLVDSHKEDKQILISVIKENTINTATNTSVLQLLHRRLDKDERDKELRD